MIYNMSGITNPIETKLALEETVKKVNKKICKILEKPCLDIAALFFPEHLEFEVNGMSVKSFYERIPHVLEIKSYSGIDNSTVKKIKEEDVKMTLNSLSKQGKIFKYQGCYSPQKTALKAISEI